MTDTTDETTKFMEQAACLDRVVPEGARLLAFGEGGQVEVRASADQRRYFVLAKPGTKVFMLGVPESLPETAEELSNWYDQHPTCQPLNFEVTEDGLAKRLAGKPRIPGAAWRHEQVQKLFQKMGIQRQGGPATETPVQKDGEQMEAFAKQQEASPQRDNSEPAEHEWVEVQEHHTNDQQVQGLCSCGETETWVAGSESPPCPATRDGQEENREEQTGSPQAKQSEQEAGQASSEQEEKEVSVDAPKVTSKGEEETLDQPESRLAELQQQAQQNDPAGRHEEREADPPEDQLESEQEDLDLPSLLLQQQEAFNWVLLGGRGGLELQQQDEGLAVAPQPSAEFVVLGVPTAQADVEQGSLATWYEDHQEARSVGYRLQEEGTELMVSPQTLGEIEKQLGQGNIQQLAGPDLEPQTCLQALQASEESRRRLRVREAVGARKLPRYLEGHGQPPPYLRGKSGDLYVPLQMEVADPDRLEVKAETQQEHPGQVLVVETLNEKTGEVQSHLFVPAGGSYVVGPADIDEGELEEQGQGMQVRPGGDLAGLGSNKRVQIWANGTRLPIRRATRSRPTPQAQSEEPAQMDGTQPPETFDYPDKQESSQQGPPPREMPPELEDMGGPPPSQQGPPPEELSRQDSPPTESGSPEPTLSSGPAASEGSAEGDRLGRLAQQEEGARWRHPDEGYMTVDNWSDRGRQGEFWVSELLEAVADDQELQELNCRVPIALLRKGFRISRTDRQRLQKAVRTLSERISEVKVFDIGNRTYFARDTEDGVQAVGPGGKNVRGEEVRRLIARAFGANAVVAQPDPQKEETARRPSR